jgi:NAD(P)H-flavin reductase
VVTSERKAFDISVLTVQPEPRLDYLPGQSVAIESPARPRLWRYYSMANAPRADGSVEFHIRLIDGGAVSMALTTHTASGTELRIGPPVGSLRLDLASGREILMIAGSTGLAPLKAMVEQLAGLPRPPAVHLFFGARAADGLYDLPRLEQIAARHPWLTVVPVVSSERSPRHNGTLTDTVMRSGNWSGHDAYLAGPTEMVQDSAARLAAAGMPVVQIHVEDFGWSEQ